MTGSDQPPFDGKPCPACPVEVRELYATAYNYVHGSGASMNNYKDLRNAVDAMEKLIEAHFKDPAHSHGRTLSTPTGGPNV